MLHQNIPAIYRHAIHTWEVADSAALAALVVSAADKGKVAVQLAPYDVLVLKDDVAPEWVSMLVPGSLDASAIDVVDAAGYYTGADLETILAEIGATLTALTTDVATKTVQHIGVAISDETTAITAGTGKIAFVMPYDFELTEVIASLSTPQASGSAFTLDINQNSASILSTKLTIDNAESSSITAATPAVLSTTTLAKGDLLTIDVDQVGDGSAKGAKVYLVGAPA